MAFGPLCWIMYWFIEVVALNLRKPDFELQVQTIINFINVFNPETA